MLSRIRVFSVRTPGGGPSSSPWGVINGGTTARSPCVAMTSDGTIYYVSTYTDDAIYGFHIYKLNSSLSITNSKRLYQGAAAGGIGAPTISFIGTNVCVTGTFRISSQTYAGGYKFTFLASDLSYVRSDYVTLYTTASVALADTIANGTDGSFIVNARGQFNSTQWYATHSLFNSASVRTSANYVTAASSPNNCGRLFSWPIQGANAFFQSRSTGGSTIQLNVTTNVNTLANWINSRQIVSNSTALGLNVGSLTEIPVDTDSNFVYIPHRLGGIIKLNLTGTLSNPYNVTYSFEGYSNNSTASVYALLNYDSNYLVMIGGGSSTGSYGKVWVCIVNKSDGTIARNFRITFSGAAAGAPLFNCTSTKNYVSSAGDLLFAMVARLTANTLSSWAFRIPKEIIDGTNSTWSAFWLVQDEVYVEPDACSPSLITNDTLTITATSNSTEATISGTPPYWSGQAGMSNGAATKNPTTSTVNQ